MKHFRVFKKFAAIMANLSLVFNNLFPLLWLVQPVYANTPEDPVPTVIEEQLNQELNQEQEQENKSDSSDIQPPASTPAPEPTPTPEATATPEPTSTPEPTPTLKSTVTPEPTPVLEPSLTPAPTLTPAEVPENSDVGNITPDPEPTPSITPVVESTPTPAKICLTDQEIKPSSIDDWNFDEKTGIAETKDPVKLGVKYQFPGEDKMSVTFTCLPETTTSLKIERIKISDLKLPEGTTALGEYAYDVTTGMDNGSFEYDITLPKPEDKKVNVVYLEKSADEVKNQSNPIGTDEIKPIEENKLNQHVDSNNVEVKDLDHFTIYIVTNPTGPTLSTAMVNGMEYVSVPPSTSVTVTLKVTTSGSGDSNDWRTTQYSFNGVNWTCVNTPNHTSSGTWTEDFTLTAPDTIGSYDLHLRVYNGDNCTGGVSETVVLDDAIRVVTSLPSPTPPPLTNNPSDPVALTSVSGIWTSIDGGSGHQGIDTSEIRWGTAAESQKSGLRFTNSGNQSFDTGETFYLGMLTHMNWPVQHGTAANGATLQITLNFDRPDIDDVVLDYDFDIEETPNSAGQCKEYQRTLTACDDKVTFPNSYATRSFRIGDIQYTLVIDGFVDAYPSGNPVNAFITEEKKDNSAFLVGHLSSVLVERPEIRLTKKTNDQDVASAPGPNLYIGDTVEWKYIVQNSGNVALTNINLTDSDLGTINCPSTELAKGAIMTCTATGIVVEGQYMNTATVVGTPPTGSNVTASDSSWYYGVQKKGHIIVDKVTNPAGDSQSFSFTTTGDGYSSFSLTDAAEPNDQELVAGIYSVTETVPTGWHSASSCTSSIAGKTQDPSALNLANGETITCTFINSKLSINVIKTANPTSVPETGGNVEFTARVNNTSPVNVTLTSLNDDKFGDITVIEGSTCVVPQTIVPGGHYECKFTKNISGEAGQSHTNIITAIASGVFDTDDATVEFTDVAPTIEVTKTASTLILPVPGGNVTFTVVVTNKSKEAVTLTSLTDDIYGDLNGQGNCATGGTINPNGGTYTCSFSGSVTGDPGFYKDIVTAIATDNEGSTDTKTDDAVVELKGGKIIIEKQTLPDGYTTQSFEFDPSWSDVNFNLTDGQSKDSGWLAPGKYSVSEIVPTGWDLTNISCGNDTDSTVDITNKTANINVSANETVRCVFTNTKRGTVVIEKNAINDSDQSFRFTNNFGNNNPIEFSLTDDTTTGLPNFEAEVLPGQYIVTEDEYESWTLTEIKCVDPTKNSTTSLENRQASIDVAPGETVTCTFTNRQKPTLTVVKKVINDNGGTKTVDDFGITFSGGQLTFDKGVEDNKTTTYTSEKLTLDKGTYTLSEKDINGYTEGTWDCGTSNENKLTTTIKLNYNQNLICTITNDDQPGTLIVKKVVNNINGGDLTADDFSFSVNDGTAIPFEADGENSLTIDAGIYTVTETPVDGYQPSYNNCSNITLANGGTATCTITNDAIFGQISVIKFNDVNGNGQMDSDEETLPNWQINLTSQDSKITNDQGSAVFNKLIPQTYYLSETLQPGWTQTNIYCDDKTPSDISNQNNYQIELGSSQSLQCHIGNRLLTPELDIAKTNNVGSSVLSPGDSVTYTIKLEVSKNDISNLKVTDLLSNGFKYRPGSYKVIKNGIEDITSQIAEPQYHSPGLWNLGSFVKGDKLDLIYIADINSNQQSGVYKDIAWAVGNNTYNQDETVLASALPEGYLDTNFVGTQVPINKAVSDSVSAEVEKVQTIEGQVLGVSTDTLPATGAATIWLLISSLFGLTGLALIFSRHTMFKNLFFSLILTAFAFGFTASPLQAADPTLFIRLQDPKTHVNTTNLDLKFVTLDISARPITVKCFKKGPTESVFSQFGGDIVVTAGGNSDQCNLASVISTPGTYQFQTKAYAGADVAESNTVFFDYQNSTPGTPVEYSKSVLDNHCDYIIKFRTANDEGRTAKVEIYRSTNPAFAADNQSLVHSINVGSDQYREVNNSVPDCSKTYYYAIRAFDIYGNGSGVTGDTVVKTVVSGDTTVINTTTTSSSTDTTGAIRVSDSNIPQEEDLNKKDDSEQTETVSPDDSTGQVLGVGSQSIKSYFADHKVLTAIIIIACLALIIYVIKTVFNKSKKS